jgi:hypothetical protein
MRSPSRIGYLGEDDDPGIAETERVARLKRLVEQGAIFARDFLEYHGIGVGLGEECGDVVHPLVAVPQIERDDAHKALTAGRGLRGRSLPGANDEHDIDRRDERRWQDEPPIARDRGKTQDKDSACRHERETVIDDVERRPPTGRQPKPGQSRAQNDACHNEGF